MAADTANKFLPLFVFIFWVTFASVFRVWYSYWTGKRWRHRPGMSMLVFPAIWLCVLMISLKVTDIAPESGAWVIIALHFLFVVGVVSLLIWLRIFKSTQTENPRT